MPAAAANDVRTQMEENSPRRPISTPDTIAASRIGQMRCGFMRADYSSAASREAQSAASQPRPFKCPSGRTSIENLLAMITQEELERREIAQLHLHTVRRAIQLP